jgi:hypothetical protein
VKLPGSRTDRASERQKPLVQSEQILAAVDLESPGPACSHHDPTSRIDRPRTNAPTIIAFNGSVRNNRVECHFGNNFEPNGSAVDLVVSRGFGVPGGVARDEARCGEREGGGDQQ